MSEHIQCVVIGAGVIGLAVAATIAKQGYEVIVLEQHELIGSETSSRNSEVIHAGIYYPQNSQKARLCVAGKKQLYKYCETHAVPFKRCGKLIVATHVNQIDTVKSYIAKAKANGVDDLHWLNAGQVNDLEPLVKTVGGVFSPSTGIIDSHAYMLSLQGILESNGGQIALQTKVDKIFHHKNINYVSADDYEFSCDWLINCAGLSAPHLAQDRDKSLRSYYAKGHYYAYSGAQPFKHLVYPVAEAGGLGVHVTLDLAGQIKFGPDVRWIDSLDYAFDESHFEDFAGAIEAYYPNLDRTRLHPSYTGIRPKLSANGNQFEDFRIEGPAQHTLPGRIDLLGIESPGLTASLAIADEVLQIVTSTQ